MKTDSLQMKRALRTALLVLLLNVVGMAKTYAQTTFTVGDLTYSVNNNEGTSVTVTGHVDGTAATGTLTIPENVVYDGINYSVTKIGYYAFDNCSGLTGTLVIPNSITEIGWGAFQLCSGFNGLSLGNSVSLIDDSAFNGCSGFIGNLVLPNSVTTIGSLAFGCRNLSGVLQLPSSISIISEEAFYLCKFSAIEVDEGNSHYRSQNGVLFTSGLDTLLLYPIGNQASYYEIPNTVKRIGNMAFYYCENLTSVSMPNSLVSIGSQAFGDCSGITSFSIPYSVISVSNSSFYGTAWWYSQNTDVVYLDGWCLGKKWYDGPTGQLMIEEGTKGIASGAFYNCSGLTSLTLPNSLLIIDNSAFGKCSGITGSLIIPNSVTILGDLAFANCTGFNGQLILSNSLTEIGYQTFENCSGFVGDLVIPNSVKLIKEKAFNGCSGFDGNLILGNTLEEIEYQAFAYCSGFIGQLIIPDAVRLIDAYAFYRCSGFIGLSIGEKVETIGYASFYQCSNFTGELVIPNSVTWMGAFAFFGCTGFTGDLVIPNSLTEIREGTFSNFSGGPMGFDGNLLIANSIRTIRDQAFCCCNNLQSITVCSATPPEIIKIWSDEEEDAFWGIDKSIPVYVQCNLANEYMSADYWNQFNNYIETLLYSLTVEAVEPEHCSVSITQQPSCTLQAVIKAIPADGYVFVGWEVDGEIVSTDSVYTFAVERDTHLFAKVKPNTGISESLDMIVSVYPNPTKGQIIIEAEGLKHIRVSNILGQRIYESQATGCEFTYDFSKHGAGLYLIRIETSSGIAVKKVSVR